MIVRIFWGAAALAVLTLAGCSGAGSAQSEGYISDEDLVARVDEVIASLDSVRWDDGVFADAADVAHENLIRKCLRSQGFQVADLAVQEVSEEDLSVQISALDGWTARGEGFGLGEKLSDPAVLSELTSAAFSSDDGEDDGGGEPYPEGSDDALYGSPAKEITIELPGDEGGSVTRPVGGCFGQATEELYGVAAEDYERAYMSLPWASDVLSETISTSDVAADVEQWSSCMSNAGYDFTDPADMVTWVSERAALVVEGDMQPSEFVSDEDQVSTDDASCKTSTGLGTSFATAFVTVGEAALKDKEGVVVEYQAMLEHASAVIAEG